MIISLKNMTTVMSKISVVIFKYYIHHVIVLVIQKNIRGAETLFTIMQKS